MSIIWNDRVAHFHAVWFKSARSIEYVGLLRLSCVWNAIWTLLHLIVFFRMTNAHHICFFLTEKKNVKSHWSWQAVLKCWNCVFFYFYLLVVIILLYLFSPCPRIDTYTEKEYVSINKLLTYQFLCKWLTLTLIKITKFINNNCLTV